MQDTVELIRAHGLVAVVSAPEEDRLLDWAIAVAQGGIKLLGIPVTFPQVTEVASDLVDEADLCVGVSGVTSVDQISIAFAAGAHFVLSPICDPEIIQAARERHLSVIASGATPTELVECARAEPDLVAVHPAGVLGGPAYVRHLVDQFPQMPLVAGGSVDVENAPSYLEVGALATIVDQGLFPKAEDPAALEVITARARALTEVCAEVMSIAKQMADYDEELS